MLYTKCITYKNMDELIKSLKNHCKKYTFPLNYPIKEIRDSIKYYNNLCKDKKFKETFDRTAIEAISYIPNKKLNSIFDEFCNENLEVNDRDMQKYLTYHINNTLLELLSERYFVNLDIQLYMKVDARIDYYRYIGNIYDRKGNSLMEALGMFIYDTKNHITENLEVLDKIRDNDFPKIFHGVFYSGNLKFLVIENTSPIEAGSNYKKMFIDILDFIVNANNIGIYFSEIIPRKSKNKNEYVIEPFYKVKKRMSPRKQLSILIDSLIEIIISLEGIKRWEYKRDELKYCINYGDPYKKLYRKIENIL